MSDEPLAKKAFMRAFGRGNSRQESESDALALSSKMPAELARVLNDDRHETPVLLRKIQGVIKKEHLRVDTDVLEAYARKIKAGQSVIDAITELKRSMDAASQVDPELDRKRQLAEAQHATKMAEETARQRALAPSPIRQQIEAERDQDELDRLRAERNSPVRKKINDAHGELELAKIRAEQAALQPPIPQHRPERMDRFRQTIEGRLAEMRKQQVERNAAAKWLKATFGAEIDFYRDTNMELEAQALEQELQDHLDTLATDGL